MIDTNQTDIIKLSFCASPERWYGIAVSYKICEHSRDRLVNKFKFSSLHSRLVSSSPLKMTEPSVERVVSEIIRSPEDKRVYRGLEFTNGLKVMLISDPTTDKSSAALDVHIGKVFHHCCHSFVPFFFFSPHKDYFCNLHRVMSPLSPLYLCYSVTAKGSRLKNKMFPSKNYKVCLLPL